MRAIKAKHLLTILLTLTAISMKAQTEINKVESIIYQFAQSGDERDIEILETTILHEEFRVTLNRLFGGEKLTTLSKSAYIQMIKDGKLGGDKRTVEILLLDIIKENAIAKVKLVGSKMTFTSHYLLVKNGEGQWQLLNDLPSPN